MRMKVLIPRFLLVGLAYYLLGRVGLEFASWNDQVSLIWPATGIALFGLLAWGMRMAPAIWLASLAINLPLGPSLLGAMIMATGNTLGPALAALALGRMGFDQRFSRARDVFLYIGFGVMAGMAVNATIGVTTLVLTRGVNVTDSAQVWLTWWLGDALGALLIGPTLLTLSAKPVTLLHPISRREAMLVWGGLIITGLACNTPLSPFDRGLPPVLSLPFLIWLANRRNTNNACLAVLLLASFSLWGVLDGMGPFVDPSGQIRMQALWSYLFILGLASLLISTLRSETDRALNESLVKEARLKEAEHIAHLGHWELDLASNRLTWSDEIYHIFGLDKATFEASYEAFLDTIHPDDRDYVNEQYTCAVANQSPYDIEHRIIRRNDGAVRWVHEHCEHLLNDQGQIVLSRGTVQDITRQRELQLAAREHLEAASWLQRQQTANELATLLAHELNQPLAAIATFAEASRQLILRPPLDQGKLAANLDRISQQALRAGDTIRHLRAFISRGQIDPVPMDLKAVIRSACDLMAPKARSAGIKLEMILNKKVPLVMGVDVHVEQVLLNLLRNAYDAIHDAGMDCGTISVELQQLKDIARVTVRDTGPGIDPVGAARLFEPLSSTKDYGLGVGLRISRSLIEAHGGRLWVEPHAPGAIFHFELPLVI